MIIVAPVGLILVILVVVVVVAVTRSTELPTTEEEKSAKNWALAQANLRQARERYERDPSDQNLRAIDEAERRVNAPDHVDNERAQPGIASSSPPGADPAEQIRKLAELRDQGIVSDEEFDRTKQQLLRQMGQPEARST